MGLKDWSLKALKTEHLTAPSPNLKNRSHTVGTVCPIVKTEHLTAPSPNLQNRSHTVGTVGLAFVSV